MKCYVRATASMPQIVKLVEKHGTVSSSDIKVVLTLLPLWSIARCVVGGIVVVAVNG